MKYDVVIIGAGLAGVTAGTELQRSGLRCCIVGGGLSLSRVRADEFVSLGGDLLRGDYAVSGVWDGMKLVAVNTVNLDGVRLEADAFILATGKFFSRGLVSEMDRITEPVFGADVEYDPCREHWYDEDFYAAQPFESFGVRTDGDGRVMLGGRPAENLYAAGEILAGNVDIVESALKVCRNLI